MVRRFPRSDIAAEAQFKSGQMLEKQGKLQRAFYEYQALVQKYPRSPDFEAALQAQYTIGKAYLDGKRVDVYGVPTLPSMAKAQEMFQKIVTNAPYSRIAPLAQYGIGQALEKSGSITATVNAYQQVVDRYPNSDVAPNALYQIGYVYFQASRSTGYDQTAAVRAQEAFDDFLLRYPNSEKVPQAQDNLKTLQGRKTENSYTIAKYYDKQKNYKAAYVYYNEVVQQQPDSPEAVKSKAADGPDSRQSGRRGSSDWSQGNRAPLRLEPIAENFRRKPIPPGGRISWVHRLRRRHRHRPRLPRSTPEQPTPEQKPMRTAPNDVTPAPVDLLRNLLRYLPLSNLPFPPSDWSIDR